MKIKEALNKGIAILKENNIEEPNLKTRMLLAYIIDKPKEYLLIHDDEQIDENDFFTGIEKITKNIPIQYVINNQEFMKLNFYVDENVLIPRFDTEILVEEVISLAQKRVNLKILDLCTGSGAIAISIAKYIEKSDVVATDINQKVLEIAKNNAKQNNINVQFLESNMFESIKQENFDFIVSNPPYIKTDVINTLAEEVKKEPLMALDGGYDGLDFYKILAQNSYKYLKQGGYLCLEIGYDQKEEVINILNKIKEYDNIYCKKDLAGNDRIIIAKRV